MNQEKEIAEIVERCYTGSASENDLFTLTEYLLQCTTVGKNIQGNVPEVVFNLNREGSVSENTMGQYDDVNQKVYINESLVSDIMKGTEKSLFYFLEAYGHEVTHHKQLMNSEYKENTALSASDIEKMFDVVGASVDSNVCENIRVGSYERQPHEVDARRGGILFIKESLEHLINNQYINVSVKEKMRSDLVHLKEHVKERNEIEESHNWAYDKFISFVKNLDINKLMHAEATCDITNTDTQIALLRVIRIWLKENEAIKVCNSYIQLIGSENTYRTLKKGITNYIMGESFPKEYRDRLTDLICRGLKKSDMETEFYDSTLIDILNREQILEIYEHLLKNNITKIDTSLFKACCSVSEYAEGMAQTMANNLNNIHIWTQNEATIFSQHIIRILWGDNKNIDEDVQNKLNKALNILRDLEFEQDNQQEKKTVR